MRYRNRRRKAQNRRGAAAVEFAVIAPLFFLLILAMVEIARMFMVQHMIVNASREGSRQAVVASLPASEVETMVEEFLVESGVEGATVTVTPDPQTARNGESITVQVSVPYNDVSWLMPMFLEDRVLKAATKMRKEHPGS